MASAFRGGQGARCSCAELTLQRSATLTTHRFHWSTPATSSAVAHRNRTACTATPCSAERSAQDECGQHSCSGKRCEHSHPPHHEGVPQAAVQTCDTPSSAVPQPQHSAFAACIAAAAVASTLLAEGLPAAYADTVQQAAGTPIAAAAEAAAGAVTSAADPATLAAASALAAASSGVPGGGYVPSPVEVGWEIWLGFIAGTVPFVIGSFEFGKRIVIQLRCEVCGGRGLVPSAGPGKDKYLRKCPQCGGFFPWISWKMFLTSAAAPGNGGPLLQPKGQTSVFYSVPEKPDDAKMAEAQARFQAAMAARQQQPQQQSAPTPAQPQQDEASKATRDPGST